MHHFLALMDTNTNFCKIYFYLHIFNKITNPVFFFCSLKNIAVPLWGILLLFIICFLLLLIYHNFETRILNLVNFKVYLSAAWIN